MAKKKIGYWMKDGKAKRINIVRISELLLSKYGVELVELDATQDTIPIVDVVFHKMSDLIFEARCGKAASVEQLGRFVQYFRCNPNVQVIDPLSNMEVLLDRVPMLDAIQRCSNSCSPDTRIYSSGYHLVVDPADVAAKIAAKEFKFPLICKSRIAQGAQGHNMSIIFNLAGLAEVKESNIIVPFIDHDALLYKVFVCGDEYNVVTRPSITLAKLQQHTADTYHFHSDTVSKCNSSTTSREQDDLCSMESFAGTPLSSDHMKQIPAWVRSLREALNLSLFGFDLLFETGTQKPYVIDINYFPSYDGFQDFHDILCEMLYKASL